MVGQAGVSVTFSPNMASLRQLQKDLAAALAGNNIPKLKVEVDTGSLSKMTQNVKTALGKATSVPLTPAIKPQMDTQSLKTAFSQMSGAFSGMGALYMGKNIMGGVKNFVGELAATGFEFEKYQINMQTMLQSTELGAGVFKELMGLATKMPGSVLDLIPAYNQLVNIGLTPTREEMYQLGEVASAMGRSVQDMSMTIQMASGGTFKRLRSMGIGVEKQGNKLIMNFRGQKQEIAFTKKAIYDYVVSLGKAKGVQGAMSKQMSTLAGMSQNIADQFDQIKFSVYQALSVALVPVLKVVSQIVEAFGKFVAAHPKLVTAIVLTGLVLAALVGVGLLVIGSIIGIALVMSGLSLAFGGATVSVMGFELALAPLMGLLLIITIVVVAVIAAFVALYVYWDEITLFMVNAWSYVVEYFWVGVYSIEAAFLEVVLYVYQMFSPWVEFFTGIALMIVGAFTMNIPLAAGGFVMFADQAANAIDGLQAFCFDVASAISDVFAKTFNGIASLARNMQGVADLVGLGGINKAIENVATSLGNKASSKKASYTSKANGLKTGIAQRQNGKIQGTKNSLDKVKQSIADAKSKGATSRDANQSAYDAKKKQKALDSKNGESFMDKAKKFMEDSGLLPTDSGQSGGNGKGKGGGGGNGTGKGKEKDGKKGSAKQAQDHAIDVATITAIKGIQKVLADMGYTLTTEIKRADLFRAQREALKAIELDQRAKQVKPVTDIFDRFIELRDRNRELNGDGQYVTINLKNIDENTTVKDLIQLAKKR